MIYNLLIQIPKYIIIKYFNYKIIKFILIFEEELFTNHIFCNINNIRVRFQNQTKLQVASSPPP